MITSHWSAASLVRYVEDMTALGRLEDNLSEMYEARFIRPVTEFGLVLDLAPPLTEMHGITPARMAVATVPLTTITSSAQREGICLDLVAHYFFNPDDLWDPDGWFGNTIPVLYRRTTDGRETYTVRDGNHRVIAALLRGDATITAHVVD